jgi:two-component system, OmpR family, sensor histidine kinase KdpD
MDDGRPNPDELLSKINEETKKESKGKLKIFFGYAAGVGKTYAMLQEARKQKEEGTDVVVALAETHGRKETEALLDGLEQIPRKRVKHENVELEEMDIDAVLVRNPQLVIVDELAHTNAPGCRHLKRFQDVEELLDMGLDVYTTLNIQHLESMNQNVAQITQIVVKETVPDSVFDVANEIKVVDVSPSELIQRFKEGKVYVPERAIVAMNKFFTTGNLIALREMTFRKAAERVDDQMRDYMRIQSISGPWPAGERLLVCISSNIVLAERLVRAGRRLADELKADWEVIHVEMPGYSRYTGKRKEHIVKALDLAESLGAKVVTVFGISVTDEIVKYAKKNNISKIIIGRPIKPHWQELLLSALSITEEVIRHSGDIDVLVISEKKKIKEIEEKWYSPVIISPYFYSAALVLFVSVFGFLVAGFLDLTNIIMFYLLAVVVTAVLWGLWPAIFTAGLSVVAFDFLFVSPRFTISVDDTQYLVTFAALFIVGVTISILIVRAKGSAAAAQLREQHISTLFSLSEELTGVASTQDILKAVIKNIEKSYGWNVVVLMSYKNDLRQIASSQGLSVDDNDLAVAKWCVIIDEDVGFDTSTLPGSSFRFIPMKTASTALGVIGIKPDSSVKMLTIEQERILHSFAAQAALALERVKPTHKKNLDKN